MNNLSPARSSLSTTATAGGGGGGNGGSYSSSVAFPAIDEIRFPEDVDSAQDQKEEALAVLKSEVKAELDKVVKSMDEDSWMFEGPRSRIHLVSRPDVVKPDNRVSTVKIRNETFLFLDGSSEVELRVIGAKDIVLGAGETTLTIKVQRYGLLTTVVEIKQLFDNIRPTETIWYAPITTKDLLETSSNQTIHSWIAAEGSESVDEAKSLARGRPRAAGRPDKWRHLYAGFTVRLSKSGATDEASVKEEAKFQDSGLGYTNADVVVKLHAKPVAKAALSAIKS